MTPRFPKFVMKYPYHFRRFSITISSNACRHRKSVRVPLLELELCTLTTARKILGIPLSESPCLSTFCHYQTCTARIPLYYWLRGCRREQSVELLGSTPGKLKQ